MQTGKVLVTQYDGTVVVKLAGDVRLTLCATIDDYFEKLFAESEFVGILIDLSETEGADSTTLGVLAKLAVQAKKYHQLVPMIWSPRPDITRLLDSMGFRRVFDIRQTMDAEVHKELGELPLKNADETSLRDKVIEAHRALMDLNAENRATFSSLVATLEDSKD